MTEQKFRSEMRRAEALRKTCDDPMMSEYWAGYIRGLRRAYHGAKFGEPGEHEKWLSAANSRDESRKQRGRGYTDGLAFEEISSRMGRPPMSDEPTETVGVRLPESVVARIPEPRSEWIRNIITKNLPQ
jgi:hypothetical protein